MNLEQRVTNLEKRISNLEKLNPEKRNIEKLIKNIAKMNGVTDVVVKTILNLLEEAEFTTRSRPSIKIIRKEWKKYARQNPPGCDPQDGQALKVTGNR